MLCQNYCLWTTVVPKTGKSKLRDLSIFQCVWCDVVNWFSPKLYISSSFLFIKLTHYHGVCSLCAPLWFFLPVLNRHHLLCHRSDPQLKCFPFTFLLLLSVCCPHPPHQAAQCTCAPSCTWSAISSVFKPPLFTTSLPNYLQLSCKTF